MRIAFLCKRRYMGKDVIDDRYARLYEIPHQLARRGHDVRGYCFSYQGAPDGTWAHEASPGRLSWQSRSPGRLYVPGISTYPAAALRSLRQFQPEVLIGASDIPHLVLAGWLSKRLGIPFVADLYDNFEGFGQARLPGMVPLLRRAVRSAELVTTTSDPLRDMVLQHYAPTGKVISMPSTVDLDVFRPRDRKSSRLALGLPADALLVGTAGGLMRSRGMDLIYQAWPRIAAARPDAHLVLAGPLDPDCSPPEGPRVHYLGQLPHARTAQLFSALDIGIIYLRDTPFGRYCFPQKAYEMMACSLPIVAASVGVMPSLLTEMPGSLYRPDDLADFERAVLEQADNPRHTSMPIRDWAQLIGDLEQRLLQLVSPGQHQHCQTVS